LSPTAFVTADSFFRGFAGPRSPSSFVRRGAGDDDLDDVGDLLGNLATALARDRHTFRLRDGAVFALS
jgi:hypothetical protein